MQILDFQFWLLSRLLRLIRDRMDVSKHLRVFTLTMYSLGQIELMYALASGNEKVRSQRRRYEGRND